MVSDDDKNGLDRVQIAPEVDDGAAYDPSYYRNETIRAAASILGPLGWTEERIVDELMGQQDLKISEFPSETHHCCK
ncbi:hypothetical protein [Halorhabdus amylolytica]|uniref:hypothetical protein n=1 Tax=Halorhabdus amylolytica TaxID=2559573 RepID=UPI0010AA51DF|nr:hypothetical protein [Halorhabdus amylolytica]